MLTHLMFKRKARARFRSPSKAAATILWLRKVCSLSPPGRIRNRFQLRARMDINDIFATDNFVVTMTFGLRDIFDDSASLRFTKDSPLSRA